MFYSYRFGYLPLYQEIVTPPVFKDYDTEEAWEDAKESHKKRKKDSLFVICEKNCPQGGEGCGSILHVKKTKLIQTQYYIEPSGCTGGDYWNNGELQIICPKCENLMRLCYSPEIEKIKLLFNSIDYVRTR